MPIQVLNSKRLFHIYTEHSSYVIGPNEANRLENFYYGARIKDVKTLPDRIFHVAPGPFSPRRLDDPKNGPPDTLPLELSCENSGDLRLTALAVTDHQGVTWCDPRYQDYEISSQKCQLPGLPQCFGGDYSEKMQQLRITMKDDCTQVEITLIYTAFDECDVIARSMMITNHATENLLLKRAMSAQVDLRGLENYVLINTGGWYARERWLQRRTLQQGMQATGSIRGATGHNHSPALALAQPGANETMGQVYGFMLGYSGNHFEGVEVEQFGMTRVILGIHPQQFSWTVEPKQSFATPEAYLTVSQQGLGQMSRNFHDFIRQHVIRSPWQNKTRPILVNTWQATHFNCNAQKIMEIAKEAAKLKIDMLVLDDGWFGHRDNDQTSLGDWNEHQEKVGDMAVLAANIHNLGLKFGLWYEPEMISEDSELYKLHPDWVMTVPQRPRCYGRNQLVLDLTRKDVVEHLFKTMSEMIRKAHIDYIKWDMNRNMTDVYSEAIPGDRQGEVTHRYMIGVYQLHERLMAEFPQLLMEGCAGGGGRFDAGMLYYVPQIWCSDNTDAMERLRIQAGTSMFYPIASIGAHVNAIHRQWRYIPFKTRGDVAMTGSFGYELDLTLLTSEEKKMTLTLNDAYHRYHDTLAQGDFYRLTDLFSEGPIEAWCAVSKDKKQAVLTVIRRECLGGPGLQPKIQIPGLNQEACYRLYVEGQKTQHVYPADLLEAYGLWILELEYADCASKVYVLEQET